VKCFSARLAPVPQHLANAQWQRVDVGGCHQLDAQHSNARWQCGARLSQLGDARGGKAAIQVDRRRCSIDALDLEPILSSHWALEQDEKNGIRVLKPWARPERDEVAFVASACLERNVVKRMCTRNETPLAPAPIA